MRIEPGQIGPTLARRMAGNGATEAAQAGGRADDTAELRQAAQEFESFLLQQLLKQARASARLLGGDTQPEMPGRDIFESWQDESYAQAIASAGGLGLADMLVRQLQPQTPRRVPEPEAEVEAVPPTPPAHNEED